MQTLTKSLYETDFALWINQTVDALKHKQIDKIDWDNLIEEVESLGKSQKHELKSRLTTLFEHGLKRCFTIYQSDYRGWEETIARNQQEVKNLLDDSPSLKNYFRQIHPKCYYDALSILAKNSDYQKFTFPETCPFPQDPDRLLHDVFWR